MIRYRCYDPKHPHTRLIATGWCENSFTTISKYLLQHVEHNVWRWVLIIMCENILILCRHHSGLTPIDLKRSRPRRASVCSASPGIKHAQSWGKKKKKRLYILYTTRKIVIDRFLYLPTGSPTLSLRSCSVRWCGSWSSTRWRGRSWRSDLSWCRRLKTKRGSPSAGGSEILHWRRRNMKSSIQYNKHLDSRS